MFEEKSDVEPADWSAVDGFSQSRPLFEPPDLMSDHTTSVESVSSNGIAHENNSPDIGVVPPGYEFVHESAYAAEVDGRERMLSGDESSSESGRDGTSVRVTFVVQREPQEQTEQFERGLTPDSSRTPAAGPGDRESDGSLTQDHLM